MTNTKWKRLCTVRSGVYLPFYHILGYSMNHFDFFFALFPTKM